jgi:flagellar biosynthesis chaperone FliJ
VNARRERLSRLRAIRHLGEDIRRRDLQAALAAVIEVEAALEVQEAARTNAGLAAHTALAADDRGEWLMAEAQIEVAGWNRQRLRVLLRAREGEVAPATEKFLESRRQHEQVKHLVDAAQQAAKVDSDRKAQAVADDWFLSRRPRGTGWRS